MTWNQYIDEVINLVNVLRLRGICTANKCAYDPWGNEQVGYYNRLLCYLIAYANLTDRPTNYYFWPIDDRQSRILFLKSLKEAQ